MVYRCCSNHQNYAADGMCCTFFVTLSEHQVVWMLFVYSTILDELDDKLRKI